MVQVFRLYANSDSIEVHIEPSFLSNALSSSELVHCSYIILNSPHWSQVEWYVGPVPIDDGVFAFCLLDNLLF